MGRAPGARALALARAAGVGLAGLAGGALLALFVQDLLAVALVRAGASPGGVSAVFALLMPVVAVAFAVAAVVIDARSGAGRGGGRRGANRSGDTRRE
ncbi:hypothetical protein [Microbacterium halophytorum]|uniref:hypothetical protein n=1 Tax=Microbacterium halophytorum TaxID=2067568 RepID=UPI000CFA93A8|nr:hypothetical protein [Microbacterium halophytorum]